jgi:acetylglutamate kinase
MSGPMVVKLGGAALKATLESPELFEAFAQFKDTPMVIVHGGGPAINKLSELMGLKSEFIDGQRVTSREHLEVVEKVLSGEINPKLVRGFLKAGRKAFGLSGVDGALLECELENKALGFVGKVSRVNSNPIDYLLKTGFLPIVAPVGVFNSKSEWAGSACNVNADLAAASLASAMSASRLLFLTDKDGILDSSGDVISQMSKESLSKLLNTPTIHAGMKVKARAILEFLDSSTSASVQVMNGLNPASLKKALEQSNTGTKIT